MKHFLQETDFSAPELAEVFALAASLKKGRGRHHPPTLQGQSWGLLFFKNSTRTRLSFEVGIRELGGHPIFLESGTSQIGRGESIKDTARVMSGYLHGLVIRCYEHEVIEEFAEVGTIPVVNALTDALHPCQILADLFTLAEYLGDGADSARLAGKRLAYFGDTKNNIANSLALASGLLGYELRLAGPADYAPDGVYEGFAKKAGISPNVHFTTDPMEAADGADAIYTDTWVSMGQDDEKARRIEEMRPYQVSEKVMAAAKKEAIFLHDLPAYVGFEVEEAVFEGPQSLVWQQAENRLHVQKAVLSVLSEAARHRRVSL